MMVKIKLYGGVKKLRIFRHRGDIYVPRTKFKSDVEQRVLLGGLCFVLIFTAVFLAFIAFKYDFSAKNFFKPDNMNIVEEIDEEILPEVSGKQNYLFITHNSQTDEMYFASLIQVDMDAVAYKICTLDKNTRVNEKTIEEIYLNSGDAGLMNILSDYFGINIDYYINESTENYSDMFSLLGKVNYIVGADVKYKDTSRYGFNIKIKEGEQNLDGDKAIKLIRYYLEKEKNYSAVNEILLNSLSQQINKENFDKRERLFHTFIEKSSTNITVKNFTQGVDNMKVLSSETTGVNVYNVEVGYDGFTVGDESLSNIRAYFSK